MNTSKPYKQVKEFHKAFGHPYNDKPTVMDKETAIARSVWILEEIVEFLNASVGGDTEEFDELIARFHFGLQDAIKKERGKKVEDILVAQADALTDISYFNYGSFTILGVEPQSLFDIVQNANMSKLGEDGKPIIREEDGKIMKPEGWQPPEPLIKKEIERQTKSEDYSYSLGSSDSNFMISKDGSMTITGAEFSLNDKTELSNKEE